MPGPARQPSSPHSDLMAQAAPWRRDRHGGNGIGQRLMATVLAGRARPVDGRPAALTKGLFPPCDDHDRGIICGASCRVTPMPRLRSLLQLIGAALAFGLLFLLALAPGQAETARNAMSSGDINRLLIGKTLDWKSLDGSLSIHGRIVFRSDGKVVMTTNLPGLEKDEGSGVRCRSALHPMVRRPRGRSQMLSSDRSGRGAVPVDRRQPVRDRRRSDGLRQRFSSIRCGRENPQRIVCVTRPFARVHQWMWKLAGSSWKAEGSKGSSPNTDCATRLARKTRARPRNVRQSDGDDGRRAGPPRSHAASALRKPLAPVLQPDRVHGLHADKMAGDEAQ